MNRKTEKHADMCGFKATFRCEFFSLVRIFYHIVFLNWSENELILLHNQVDITQHLQKSWLDRPFFIIQDIRVFIV